MLGTATAGGRSLFSIKGLWQMDPTRNLAVAATVRCKKLRRGRFQGRSQEMSNQNIGIPCQAHPRHWTGDKLYFVGRRCLGKKRRGKSLRLLPDRSRFSGNRRTRARRAGQEDIPIRTLFAQLAADLKSPALTKEDLDRIFRRIEVARAW